MEIEKAFTAFMKNQEDILRLLDLSKELSGGEADNQARIEVVNRSAIVFTTACWESYIEDLALEAFTYLVENADQAEDIPIKVRTLASKSLKDAADPREIWKLADEGWRKIIEAHSLQVRERWLEGFHSPKSNKVDELFEEMLGLKCISSCWSHEGLTAEHSRRRLDEFITIRGNIAHRSKHDTLIDRNLALEYLMLVYELVILTEERVIAYLKTEIG